MNQGSDTYWMLSGIGRVLFGFVFAGAIYSLVASITARRFGGGVLWFTWLVAVVAFTVLFRAATGDSLGLERFPAGTARSVTVIAALFVTLPTGVASLVIARRLRKPPPPSLARLVSRGTVAFALSIPLGFLAGVLVDIYSLA